VPDDAESGQPELLHIDAQYLGSKVIIVLAGEFDLSGTELFSTCGSHALSSHPSSIVVEAGRLGFIDSAGVMAVWRARDATDAAGVGFRVSNATGLVRHAIELLGLYELLWDD
jgi:anti-anti-sigma factor